MADSDLAFFVLLARRGSFTATGRDLAMSASAVSRRLARLENRLGVRLLNRTTRRVSLTGEGEAYLSSAVRILSEIEALEHDLAQARGIPSGLLRINATLGFGRTYLAPAVSTFKHRFPKVEVQLVLTDAPLNLVEEGFDLGIRFGASPASRMISRTILRNRRFLCASPAYFSRNRLPEALADLHEHNCIVLRQDLDTYDVWRFDERDGQAPAVKVSGDLSTNDGEIALGWVLGGHGIMLRSEWDIARYIRDRRLCIVLPCYFQTAYVSAVYPERHNLSAKVRMFIEHLSEHLKEVSKVQPLGVTSDALDVFNSLRIHIRK